MLAPSWTPYRAFFDNPMFWADNDGNIEWPLKGTKVANRKDLPKGKGDANTIVRTSIYKEIRDVGSSPHIGIDYRASIRTAVYSLGVGIVSRMYTTKSGIIILEMTYGDGDKFRFLHLSKYAKNLKVGDEVEEGQIIAYSGNSGGYPAHLHVDAKDKNGNIINPEGKNYCQKTNAEFFGTESKVTIISQTPIEDNLVLIQNFVPVDATYVAPPSIVIDPNLITFTSNLSITTYKVTASALNIRTIAGTSNSKNGNSLHKGTIVTGTGNTDGDWAEVNTSDGRIGWIHTKYTKSEKESKTKQK